MANLSKPSFFDAGKNPPRKRKMIVDGEIRIEHIPNGAVERWVKSNGSVVFQQLLQPGALPKLETIDAARGEIRRRKPDGADLATSDDEWKWIEWHRCPLRTGALSHAYFPDELRGPCSKDKPTRGDLACPHVEHVIVKRRAAYVVAQAKLHEAALAKQRAEAAEKAAHADRQERMITQQAEANQAMIDIAKGLAAGQLAAARGDGKKRE